jgi:hypothetical protein
VIPDNLSPQAAGRPNANLSAQDPLSRVRISTQHPRRMPLSAYILPGGLDGNDEEHSNERICRRS